MCERHGLEVLQIRGLMPEVLSRSFLKMLAAGRVDNGFRFRFTRFPWTGYAGFSRKR